MDKSAIRSMMKAKRVAVLPAVRDGAEALVWDKLCLSGFLEAEEVLVYVSFGDEFPTELLRSRLLAAGKRVSVPKVKGTAMSAVRIGADTVWTAGAFGVPEPEAVETVDPYRLDLILVPGLAFDRQGNRLGYGKGYFDRFLAETPAVSVGLAFDEQIAAELPAEPHDRRVDAIVTPTTLIQCSADRRKT